VLWAGIRCPVGTRGGGERWQSEAVGGPWVVVVVEDPERCSGLVYGVPLGHGAEAAGGGCLGIGAALFGRV
jgi:hypothetical protein